MISYTLRSEQTLSKLGLAAEFKTVKLRTTFDIKMTWGGWEELNRIPYYMSYQFIKRNL